MAARGPRSSRDSGTRTPVSRLSWSLFLLDYGAHLHSLPPRETMHAPIHNVAYERQVLLDLGSELEGALAHGDQLMLLFRARSHRTYFQARRADRPSQRRSVGSLDLGSAPSRHSNRRVAGRNDGLRFAAWPMSWARRSSRLFWRCARLEASARSRARAASTRHLPRASRRNHHRYLRRDDRVCPGHHWRCGCENAGVGAATGFPTSAAGR